jgi:hypothetical protein
VVPDAQGSFSPEMKVLPHRRNQVVSARTWTDVSVAPVW